MLVFKKQLVPKVTPVLVVRRNDISLNVVQPENAVLPILIIALGIVTEVKPVHPRNADVVILAVLAGNDIFFNDIQP
jgi:hypothetical protein